MNIYEKLQTIRVDLQSSGVKKTGQNSFAKYKYFELGDILPKLNELMEKYKVATIFNVYDKNATLRVIDSEKPEDSVRFEIPTADANLKGTTPIQDLGARITYLRRYALQVAFEIVENDAVDSSKPETDQELEDKYKQQILATNTPQELVTLCKDLRDKLDKKYLKSITSCYSAQLSMMKEAK